MALVSQGFKLTVTLVDTSNSKSTLTYNLVAADATAAAAAAAIILAALAAVTLAAISGYSISEAYIEDAFALPVAAENAIKAQVSGLIDGFPNKTGTFNIPAPSISIFNSASGAGYNQVDLDSANLVAYADVFSVGGQATISDGELLDGTLVSGKRISVRSRNP